MFDFYLIAPCRHTISFSYIFVKRDMYGIYYECMHCDKDIFLCEEDFESINNILYGDRVKAIKLQNYLEKKYNADFSGLKKYVKNKQQISGNLSPYPLTHHDFNYYITKIINGVECGSTYCKKCNLKIHHLNNQWLTEQGAPINHECKLK